MAEGISQAKILGQLDRQGVREAFAKIDCVVCASLEDCLPIVMTEGMMHGKVCITTDATGTADFIRDGVNGFICEAGSAESLARKMQYVLEHRDSLGDLRRAARETYEQHFTMEAFGKRLEQAMLEVEAKWRPT